MSGHSGHQQVSQHNAYSLRSHSGHTLASHTLFGEGTVTSKHWCVTAAPSLLLCHERSVVNDLARGPRGPVSLSVEIRCSRHLRSQVLGVGAPTLNPEHGSYCTQPKARESREAKPAMEPKTLKPRSQGAKGSPRKPRNTEAKGPRDARGSPRSHGAKNTEAKEAKETGEPCIIAMV